MSARRDAALTGLVLAVLLVAGVRLAAAVTPVAIASGVVATVLPELILTRHRRVVRSLWSRAVMQAASVLSVLISAAAATVLVGPVVRPVAVAPASRTCR